MEAHLAEEGTFFAVDYAAVCNTVPQHSLRLFAASIVHIVSIVIALVHNCCVCMCEMLAVETADVSADIFNYSGSRNAEHQPMTTNLQFYSGSIQIVSWLVFVLPWVIGCRLMGKIGNFINLKFKLQYYAPHKGRRSEKCVPRYLLACYTTHANGVNINILGLQKLEVSRH